MSQGHQPRPPRRPARMPLSTIVAVLVALPLFLVCVLFGHRWYVTRARLAALQAEEARLASGNAVLKRAEEALRPYDFQVCNKSADPLLLPWVAAVHHDGQRLLLFDSARCRGWRAPVLAPGETRPLLFSSTEEGCNWSGQVLFYAFNAVRDADDGAVSYDVIGPWGRDFDPKCFNVR